MLLRPSALLLALCAMLLTPSAAHAQRHWFADGPTPLRYEIAITPDAAAGSFTGEARITIESSETLSSVTMNQMELAIASATINGARAQFAADNETQTLTLTPTRPLRPGRHTIRIAYSGRIYDEAYGLFRVSYSAGGQDRRALATQFEPGDARRMAPMWDQPNLRAVFSLTVTAPTSEMVVGNMPIQRAQRLARGLTRTTFADTPSMPSYLLFLAVGDFERITQNVDGVELGVVVRRGETERARYALQAGAESLRYFTEYFGIRYPLPKLDMIGVPGAGGFGAMENWGAILYFDQYLLLDARSSEADKRTVFEFVAHEVAHQWFGNLVTMNWWDDLWLNEGFASWMESKAMEAMHPDWEPWLAQQSGGTATAMAIDSREGTHPVVQVVNTIDDANLAFDMITYQKGLAIVRMLEAYVGEEDFRQGVRDYLNSRLYGSAQTEDLWRAVQAASGQPILDIARSFTGQNGFPIVQASSPDCVRTRGSDITLTQRRFAMDDASRTGERWSIPVVIRRGEEIVRTVFPAEQTMRVEMQTGCAPYLVNAGQSGFFRVLYDQANFQRLRDSFATLETADQLGLLLDYWAFGRSGDAPFTNYLDLVSQLPADANPTLVDDTTSSLAALVAYATGRPGEANVRTYALRTLRPFFAHVGWQAREGEHANAALTRARLITALGGLGDEEVIAEVRRRVDADDLPSGIAAAVLGVYAANVTPSQYDALVTEARSATDFVEQRRAWLRVASARDPALAQRTLQLVLGEAIPRQIRTQVISVVSGSHNQLAWDFLVANRAAIEALLDPLQRLEYPPSIASGSSNLAMIPALEAYARDFPDGARPTVAAAIANIRIRAETVSQRMPAVEAWIAAREAPPPQRRRGAR